MTLGDLVYLFFYIVPCLGLAVFALTREDDFY